MMPLGEKLEPGFARKIIAELFDIFLKADIWAAPVNTFPAVERDPQVLHNQSITSYEHPEAGTFRTIRPPWRFSRTTVEIKRPPLKGEHTTEILEELGYIDDQIADLQNRQVV